MLRRLIMFIPALCIAAYVAATAGANIATANLTPIFTTFLGEPVVITAGTFFIGATFFLRDAVQVTSGRHIAYAAIAVALGVNLVLSLTYGDLLWITFASALALAVSELVDTAIFTRFGHRVGTRVLLSGAASVPTDSALFVLLGLSPLTTNIVPWAAVIPTILLQALIKFALQLVVAIPTMGVMEAGPVRARYFAAPMTADYPLGIVYERDVVIRAAK